MYQYTSTCTYDREILVLPCTMLYQYVLVRTSMYLFAQSCPGVQDSSLSLRCSSVPVASFAVKTRASDLAAFVASGRSLAA